MIKKLKRGQYYITRDGWTAVCIWVNANDLSHGGHCIHKPGDKEHEEGPIYHWGDGTSHTPLAFFPAPTYDVGHPADLNREIQKTLTIEKEAQKQKIPKSNPSRFCKL